VAEAWAINADGGSPAYSAQELRRIAAMHLFPGVSDRFGARAGVRPTGLDIVSASGTTWTQHDLTAVVYPGLTSISGPYVVEAAEESGSFDPADGSNDRIDALDLLVEDDDEDASGERQVTVVYVAGTPSGSPAAPAVTTNALRLGTFLVSAGGSPSPSVLSQAQWTVASGGVLPIRDTTERPAAGRYEGMLAYRADVGVLEVWDGAAWQPLGGPGRIPGQRVGVTENTADGSGFTSETVLMSITVSLLVSATYSVWSNPAVVSTVDGDKIRVRLREDSISGTTIDSTMVDSNQAGSATTRKYAPVLLSDYTPGADESKTFVVTGELTDGSGSVHLEGGTDRKSYIIVRYESG